MEGLERLIYLSAANASYESAPHAAVHPQVAVHSIPLTDPGGGGLYGGNSNQPPPALLNVALGQATAIQPLARNGQPSPKGKTGVIVIGESVTRLGFSPLGSILHANRGVTAPGLALVNGAQDGVVAQNWSTPGSAWSVLASRVHAAGLSNSQVQVLLLDSAIANPWNYGPGWDGEYSAMLTEIASMAKAQYPNLRLVYLSSDYYAGYAGPGRAEGEPYAYDSGFAVRNLVLSQLGPGGFNPVVGGVTLLWGPYFWADGRNPRAVDGLTWNPSDFRPDGIHESASGQWKYAQVIYSFLTHDVTATRWFLRHVP